MARGTTEKQEVISKIMSTFDGAFVYDGVIRIPVGDVQIKVALTCAKDNVTPGGDIATPGEAPAIKEGAEPVFEQKLVEPSEDELNEVSNLMSKLNL